MTATGFVIPAEADLEAVIGADFEADFVFYNDVEQTSLFDLTGNTISMQIGGLFTLTSGAGLTIGGGTVTARLAGTQTATVTANPPGARVPYWLKFVDGGGTVSYPVHGGVSFVNP